MNLAALITDVARRQPQAPAVTCGGVTRTYAQFADRSLRLAAGLLSSGLADGDRVIVFMENCGEYLEVLIACWAAGLVAVPVNAKLHHREVAHIASDSRAAAMFTTLGVAEAAAAAASESGTALVVCADTDRYERMLSAQSMEPVVRAPSDLAWLFYTSGTTGRPKGAMLTHRTLLFMSHAYLADIDQLGPLDTKLHAGPMSHASGLYALPHLLKGGHQVVIAGFDIPHIEDAFQRYDRITMFAVPTTLTRLVAAWQGREVPLQRLKTIYYGGAPMYVADLKRAIDLLGPRLFQLFGQGESPMTITGLEQRFHRNHGSADTARLLASCGYARTGVGVAIVGSDGQPLPAGEVGEVITRSDCVMKGYWNNPKANADALRDGWLHTGDLGSMAVDGLLTLTDRSKDLIISGGTNIYPREIEEVLLTHNDIVEAAVVGAPDREWGEHVVAFVVMRPGTTATPAELDRLCLNHLARFKRPKHYRFVEVLPKSGYGKILKTELRRLLPVETPSS